MLAEVIKPDWKTRSVFAGGVALLSVSLLLLSGNLLIVSTQSRRFYIFAMTVLLLLLIPGERRESPKAGRMVVWGAGALLSALFFALHDNYRMLLFFNLTVWACYCYRRGEFWRCSTLVALFYTLFWFAYSSNYLVFNALDGVSEFFSERMGLLFLKQPHILGPSASGLLVLLPFLFCFLAFVRKSLASALIFSGGTFLIWGLYQASGRILFTAFAQVTSQLVIIPAAFLLFCVLPAAEERIETKQGKGFKRIGPTALFCAAAVLLLCRGFAFDAAPGAGKRILFFEKGFFDLKTPNFEEFGTLKGGLFGLLPKHLRAYGYTCSATGEDLGEEELSRADILVITNPQKDWLLEELKAVWDFVGRGGGLLVLGDHTDIMGTQKVLNTLLKPVKTTFNFDSGFPCRTEWKHCVEPRPHPINAFVRGYHDLTVSVGATLNIEPPTYPVLVGKFGFADYGNRENVQGAFLGDYRYQLGEKLGDVVLAAACNYGKGKVLVFGDTSPFQNGALAGSFPRFVYQVFEWLSGEGGNLREPWPDLLGWCLLAIGGCWLSFRWGRWEFLAVLLAITGALLWSQYKTRDHYRFEHKDDPILWVDLSHNEKVAFYPFQRNSVGGLFQNTVRNGYYTYVMEDFSRARLLKSRVFVSVAPSKGYNDEEIKTLREYMEQGGAVILSAGYEDRPGSRALLRSFGLDIADVPLGPVPIVKGEAAGEKDVQFVSAWPIVDVSGGKKRNLFRVRVLEDSIVAQGGRRVLKKGAARQYIPVRDDLEVLYRHKGYAIAVMKRVGRGAFVFIADSLFLGEENLEALSHYKEGNILFLKSIFERIKTLTI